MDNDTSRRRFKAMVPWSGVTMVGSSRGQVGRRRECIYQEEIRDEPRVDYGPDCRCRFQAFDRAGLCQICIYQARLRADAAEPARPAVAGPAVARARVRV